MQAIQYVGLALIVASIGLIAWANWPRTSFYDRVLEEVENSGFCAGCEEEVDFDWMRGDYPLLCGSCLFDRESMREAREN